MYLLLESSMTMNISIIGSRRQRVKKENHNYAKLHLFPAITAEGCESKIKVIMVFTSIFLCFEAEVISNCKKKKHMKATAIVPSTSI